MAKLKVYRTPIGFHDAYVAASSQKAALAAWGSDKDLFARGVAEVVDDPALTAEALARPGEVVKRLRASAEEQIAAAPPKKPVRREASSSPTPAAKKPEPKPKPKPKPSRGELDQAEERLDAAERRHQAEDEALRAEEQAIGAKRRAVQAAYDKEAARLAKERDRAAAAYEQALSRWRG